MLSQISSEDMAFIESFVGNYECVPEGRYTHEYHQYLLSYTANSLQQLVNKLQSEGLNIKGRMVILGYEENAVPTYYTDFTRAQIDDEMTLKNSVGWSKKNHNYFGFMTAFLLKDLNKVSAKIYGDGEPIFEHVDVDSIPLFNDRADIFQEHAFGESLDLITQAYKSVLKKYSNKDINGVLKDLVKFWELVYKHALKVSNKQIGGTQDILFSIECVKGLLESDVEILKFFTGPDLTYPIEISCKQKKGVTRHAQKFVQKMVEKLVPVDNQKTVYVFCSFVDGVGKSTMLGNIKNWMKYGGNIDQFGHVDNTSSQLGELFAFDKDVYIADLPAQISHFTYKPNGFVYTDISNELEKKQISEVEQYVEQNRSVLIDQHTSRVNRVKQLIKDQGLNHPDLNDIEQPENWFIKNVILLKKEKLNNFIPFSFHGQDFIFNFKRGQEIRVLKKLENVKSDGLKNIESEQMIFNLGVQLPFQYDFFLSDLVGSIKEKGIRNIIFVDFLSMYPRSSRENIRVNYLLQLLSIIYPDIDTQLSFYRDFVNGGELLFYLLNKHSFTEISKFLCYETEIRLALFKLILQNRSNDLTGVSSQEVTNLVSSIIKKNGGIVDSKFLRETVFKKLSKESDELDKVYGLSKSFINIQQFSFKQAFAFFNVLQDLFSNRVRNANVNSLWQYCGDLLDDGIVAGSTACNFNLKTTLNFDVRALFMFERECRCEILLSPFLRMLRANWYASIRNLFFAKPAYAQDIELSSEFVNAVPCLLSIGQNGCIYLVQRSFPFYKTSLDLKDLNKYKIFNLRSVQQPACFSGGFIDFADLPYRYDWNAGSTNAGIYQFDCNLNELKKMYGGSITSYLVRKYQSEREASTVMPTSVLLEKMSASLYWKSVYTEQQRYAKQNGLYDFNKIRFFYEDQGRANRICLGSEKDRFAAKLFVRLIATLEMVLKDPDSDIVVRFGNRQDFKAAIRLLEMVTLPTYFGLLFKEPLFKDYDAVEPYPSWDYWDNL
jgi:hypothetical protein